jgi:flagellar hook-associated protein 3 FlgL
MRVSTAQVFRQSIDAMLERQRELAQTELQVASGKRIQRPSDDPSAALRILDIQEAQQRLAQYQRNADAAMARLAQEETALIGIENLLQRVRELAVQGANGTLSDEDRDAIAVEVREHMDAYLQLANTRDANGEYIFAGFQSLTRPFNHDGAGGFSYDGDDGQRMLKIGDSREVATGDPGSIFEEFPAAAGAGLTTNIGEVLYTLATTLEAGNGYPEALTDIDTAVNRLLDTRAKIGARMNAIEDQKSVNDAFTLAVTDVRSTLEDLDYAEAISRFNQQMTALQASQQAFVKIQDMSLFNFLR